MRRPTTGESGPGDSGTGHSLHQNNFRSRDARPRDSQRNQVYAAERLVHRIFDQAEGARQVQLAGTHLTLPAEAMFASVDSVRHHLDRVLALPSVNQRFARAGVPVSVRERRGHRSADYRPGIGESLAEIAIPVSTQGRWALRELVVLHELAHHFDDSADAAHGPGFVLTLIDLVGLVLGPEAQFVYRVVFTDSGVVG